MLSRQANSLYNAHMRHLIIIGGGIAGLAAAHRVQEAIGQGAQVKCTVLEASGRFGGKINTRRENGCIIESGPDSFITQKPQALALCKKLGLGDRIVGTRKNNKTFIYLNRRMLTLPDGLSLMVPTKFLPFITTSLFTWPGKIRMGLDLILPRRRSKRDESLASFVRRRFGQEAVDRLAQPLLSGIYSSDPEKMSMRATFPRFLETEKKYGSLIVGMLAAKKAMLQRKPEKPAGYQAYTMFVTLKNGMSELVETLIEKCPDIEFKNNAPITGMEKSSEGVAVTLESGEVLNADAVLVATPANVTARLTEKIAPEVSEKLSSIPFVSTAGVVLGFKREGFKHPLKGFGFVVPATENRKITACTWVSSKFPCRAPDDTILLRAFVGGALKQELAEQTPEQILKDVKGELHDIMGITETPEFEHVFQYKKGNVQYPVHHEEMVASIEEDLKNHQGLFMAGSAFKGVGIPDCIAHGTEVTEQILDYLSNEQPNN